MRTANVTRRRFLKAIGLGAAAAASGPAIGLAAQPPKPTLNVLLMTADDMNCDSIGAYGCKVAGTTPNLDKLASQSLRFNYAHVTIAVCQPCRGVLMTGRYPRRSGIEGFQHITSNIPTFMGLMRKAGYVQGILGKVGHCTPKTSFKWDMQYDMGQLGMGRSPQLYYKHAKAFMARAKAAGKPFFLMANSHDPHRPFHGSAQEGARFRGKDVTRPTRVFKPGEIRIPGFLPDLPEVRKEIAEYYSSVRRCDDTLGAVLKALDECGLADTTLVMFLSDHGMALPFAKTNCYLHSTHTPWMVRWPGKTKGGTVDGRHFISGIDFMPTVFDAAGVDLPEGLDGKSFVPLLTGQTQAERDKVFTQFHQTAGRRRYPMRCVQNKRFGYIFNPWSDGKRVFKNESQSGRTFKAMRAAAPRNPKIAARVKLFQYRVVEEFYDLEKDPDARHNLVGNPGYKKHIDTLRADLAGWMRRTGDSAIEAFENRSDPEALAKFMAAQDAKARGAGSRRRKNARKGKTR